MYHIFEVQWYLAYWVRTLCPHFVQIEHQPPLQLLYASIGHVYLLSKLGKTLIILSLQNLIFYLLSSITFVWLKLRFPIITFWKTFVFCTN